MAPGQAHKQPTAAELAKIDGFFIPADKEDWMELTACKDGLKNQIIHTIPAEWVTSASEATHAQYAMLRSYTAPMDPIKCFETKCEKFGFTTEILTTAADILAASPEWSQYLHLLDTGDSIDDILVTSDRWPGSFATARRLQEQTMTVKGIHDGERMEDTAEGAGLGQATQYTRRKPRRMAPLPDAEDEAVPNAAAIIILQTLSQFAHAKLEWILNRVHFVCELKQTKFSALTDGALRSKNTMDIFAVVEVKKRMRTVNRDAILIQEACEVAGWLMNSHGQMAHFNGHFMLISQDRHQLFITFVPFEKGHYEYLRNGSTTDTFLVMKSFGPFHTGEPSEMYEFGRILLAAILIVKPLA